MITIGVDFSKRTSVYHVLDNNGKKMMQSKLNNDRETIDAFFKQLPEEPKQLAMEATRNWGLFYETVIPYVDEFHLGHPKKMKAITESSTKNDQKDAQLIAQLLHSGFLPPAHVALLDTRQLRSLLRFRHFWVQQRKSIRNQIHILIDRNLWPSEKPQNFKNLFCQRGRQWLKEILLPERERFILNQSLNVFDELSAQIDQLDQYIATQTQELPGKEYLSTVPGFKMSKVHSYIVLLETDDITRFKKAKHFAHYAGLIPREHSSGDKHRTGRLIKDANMFLRTAILESTLSAIRCDRGLQAYYKQVKQRCGSGPAIVACARKLSYAIYHVLKEQRSYRAFEVPPAAACHSASVSS